jgi:Flp pilus assembly secretin CpaC
MLRLAIGDPDVAEVKNLGEGQLLISGAGEGKTTLLVWTASGERLSYVVDVRKQVLTIRRGPGAPAVVDPASGPLDFDPGEQKVLRVPGATQLAIGDPDVAEANVQGTDQVLVEALGTGKTTLLVFTSSGQRLSFLIRVRKP